jgi:hypothetical protein
VTIVENSGDPTQWTAGDPWTVAGEASLDIGVLEGAPAYQLFEVSGVVRLADGRIVVANAGSHELRFFDGEGVYLRSVGREGSGPGEFQRMSWLRVLGEDSLAVFDASLRRVSLFGTDGGFGRTFLVASPGEQQPRFALGMFDDGQVLVMALNILGSQIAEGYQRRTDTYEVYSREGEFVSRIGGFRGQESFIRTGTEGGGRFIAFMAIPFGRSPVFATAGNAVVYGSSDTYEFAVYARDGTIERIVRAPHPARPVTEADYRRYVDQEVEEAEGETRRSDIESRLRELPRAQTMPAYDELVVDAAGNIWVRDFEVERSAPRAWTVFDAQGRMLGPVTVPAGLRIRQIGDDYLLGTWRDDFDVEHVRLYRLEKRAA